jgi:MoaA/NifB/PqqE/SkfB family radical SAM enzyme
MENLYNLCPAPWVSEFHQVSGKVTPCCFINYRYQDSLDTVKADFLQNIQPMACSTCFKLEKNNLHSARHDFLDFASKSKNFDISMPNESIETIDIQLGTTCNAQCIMCKNASSSRNTWAKKYNKFFYVENMQEHFQHEVDFSKYPNLRILKLIGGEPTHSPLTKKILRQLIDLGKAREIIIGLNTNASILDDELIDMLQQFKQIMVTLSIDGVGKYFEYQRRPLAWKKVSNIAKKWIDISEFTIINYVVTCVSIWGFNDFIEWTKNLPKNKDIRFIFSLVADVPYLSLNALTDDQKTHWMSKIIDHPLRKEIETMLLSSKANKGLSERFLEAMKLEDSASKLTFDQVFPNWSHVDF